MSGYDGRGRKFPLTIVRGTDVAFQLTVTSGGTPVNMLGTTITASIFTNAGVLVDQLSSAVSGAGSNVVTLSLTDAETALLLSSTYRWSLVVTRGGDVRTWLAGTVRVVDSDEGGASTSGNVSVTVDDDVNIDIDVVGGPGGGSALGSSYLTIVTDNGDPISDANTARPAGAAACLWVMAYGVVPVNAVFPDIINTATAPADVTAPAAPTALDATAGDTEVVLTWTDPADVDLATIGVYQDTVLIDSVVAGLEAYTVTGLTNEVEYSFTVDAADAVPNRSAQTAAVLATPEASATAPDAPTGLTATAGDGEVDLAWTASTGATGHRVYRHTADVFASASQIGSDLGAAAASYNDATVTNGTEYFYWVTAFNGVGESDESTGDSATPAAASVRSLILAQPTLKAFYEVSEDTYTVDTGSGTTWLDESGNGLHITRPAGLDVPDYIASSTPLNGVPAVLKDTTTKRFNSTTGLGPNGGAYTWIFGLYITSTASTQFICGSSSPSSEGFRINASGSSSAIIFHNGVASSGVGSAITNTKKVLSITYDGATTCKVFVDGTQVGSDLTVAAAMAAANMTIMGFGTSTTTILGSLSNIVVFDDDDVTARQQAEDYIMDRLGIV